MNFGSGLQTHSKKAIKTLTLRKSNLLLSITLTLVLFLFLSSLGNAENVEIRNRDTISIQQTDPPDMDDDGLSDQMEMDLGTAVNDKFGDKDNDGLYDFEEYLDYYGNNDTTDGRKYDYNDSTSVVDGVLDIYHYFGLSSNKTTYLRDQNFTQSNSGFTDTLLWNVNFSTTSAGGGSGAVNYSNNIMTNVNFSGISSGGVFSTFQLSYNNNTMINVNFAGNFAGGSQATGPLSYSNNTMTNVSFTGTFSGASSGTVRFTNNIISDILIGLDSGAKSDGGISIYMDNVIVSDRHDTDSDGLGDGRERFVTGTNPTKSDSDGDNLGDKWEVTYNGSSGVNPLDMADTTELASDEDLDELNLTEEFKANTNPTKNDTDGDGLNDSYELNLTTNPTLADTDGDDLGDKWELTYNGTSGINPTTAANATELASDGDSDGLNLTGEFEANTNPTKNDTDGDGLADGWEVRYSDASGVNPLDNATAEELASDEDKDGLNLTAEFKANTNPSSNDTDGDGLNDSYELGLDMPTDPTLADTDGDGLGDKWELTHNGVPGVNPLVKANDTTLASDTDGDGLTLLQEARANTDPSSNDTDGDGLVDKWEATYDGRSGVNPLVGATPEELASDTDNDGLTLLEEEQAKTDPSLNDTDEDGLADKWEVTYNGTPGVNPLVGATPEELASDTDNDGLSLLEEAKANTDPGTADNPMPMNTTTSTTDTTGSTDSAVSSSELSLESSFAFLVVLGIFTSFSLVLVVYRVRRRIL